LFVFFSNCRYPCICGEMTTQRWVREIASRPSITLIPETIVRHIVISFLTEVDAFKVRGVCWSFYKAYFDQDYPGFGDRPLLSCFNHYHINCKGRVWSLICRGCEFRNLKCIGVRGDSTFDISLLSRLPALESLTIVCGNTLESLDAFPKNLVKLTELKIQVCVKDLSGINGCVRLQELHLRSNSTVQLHTIPSTLSCLRLLSLVNCGMYDLSFLTSLSRFKNLTELNLSRNSNLDLTTMPNNICQVLTKLDLCDCNLRNVSSLGGLCFLEKLDLSWNKDLELDTFPRCLTRLRTLKITDCNLYALVFLERIPALEELHIGTGNAISLESVPYNLTNLKILTMELRRPEKRKLSVLSRFPKLTELKINETRHFDLSSLPTNLLHLRKLSLTRCDLKDFSALNRLSNLEECDLSENENIDITSIPVNLTCLRKLTLRYCKLSDISSFGHFPALEELDLSRNPLKLDNVSDSLMKIRKVWIGQYAFKVLMSKDNNK